MRIGLLRHFPVQEPMPTGWISALELRAWRDRYDRSNTLAGEFDLGGVDWTHCWTSDATRTLATARTVFQGHAKPTPLLREVNPGDFATGSLRLPGLAWQWLLRAAWMTDHPSQRDARRELERRIKTLTDQLTVLNENILLVSHAGTMAYLSRELLRRGYQGPKLNIAKPGVAYVYSRGGGRESTNRNQLTLL